MCATIDSLGDAFKRSNSIQDFDKLIRAFRPEILKTVKAMLKRYGCPLAYAEDIGSEIEYKLYSSIPTKYNPTDCGFSHWAHVIIANHTMDYIRSRKKTVELTDDMQVQQSASHLIDVDLEFGTRRLTPMQKTTITIVYIEGHTYKEAGQILGVSTGTAWNTCKEAIEIIKETFKSQ